MSVIEKIVLSPTLSIWKSSFDITNKEKLLLECEEVIRNKPNVNTDGYAYYINNGLKYDNCLDIQIKSELDLVMSSGINACIELYDNIFNEIKTDVWINVVRAKNPVQKNYRSNAKVCKECPVKAACDKADPGTVKIKSLEGLSEIV